MATMSRFNLAGLSAMQVGRVNKALDTLYSFSDGVYSLRTAIEQMSQIVKEETDGMIDYNRRHFNHTSDQGGYEARLKAKRIFYISNLRVPKIVYDVVVP